MLRHRTEYLSKNNLDCLKCVFAFAIIICHLFSKTKFGVDLGLGPIFTSLGYLSVSIFLFSSGYGLTISYINKGKQYLNGFLIKRVLPIYIINALLVLLYALYDLISGNAISLKIVFQSFLFGNTVVKYGWYIQMILLFYILYYFIIKYFSLNKGMIVLSVFIVLYCLFCGLSGLSSTWYECSGAFLLGILWAKNKLRIDNGCNSKKYLFFLIADVILFGTTYIFGNVKFMPEILRITIKFISAVLFVIMMLLIIMRIKINFQPIKFLSKYFFEMYILQGLFISLFNEVFIIENTALYCATCIGCTIITAIIIHPVLQLINKKCKELT